MNDMTSVVVHILSLDWSEDRHCLSLFILQHLQSLHFLIVLLLQVVMGGFQLLHLGKHVCIPLD